MLGLPNGPHPIAKVVGEHEETGMPIFKCPQCGKEEDFDGCDVGGADPGCLFCTNCHCEFDASAW